MTNDTLLPRVLPAGWVEFTRLRCCLEKKGHQVRGGTQDGYEKEREGERKNDTVIENECDCRTVEGDSAGVSRSIYKVKTVCEEVEIILCECGGVSESRGV